MTIIYSVIHHYRYSPFLVVASVEVLVDEGLVEEDQDEEGL